MKVKEIIVVEGRDDTTAVTRAIDCDTIETHGFGIKKETWNLLKKAYNERGLIVFTDPDYSGEEIRRRLSAEFPEAKHAYLSRSDAKKGSDIGIENADDKSIIDALLKAKAHMTCKRDEFTAKDLQRAGLTGLENSKELRQKIGKELGIGYGNSNSLLKKLNSFGITREAFEKAVEKIREEI